MVCYKNILYGDFSFRFIKFNSSLTKLKYRASTQDPRVYYSSYLLQQFCIGISNIWQVSHTLRSNTCTYIKMSGAPLTVSDSVLFGGGCWVSLLQLWCPVWTGNYVVGYFSWLPPDPGHRDSLIFLTTHACHRKCLLENNISYLHLWQPGQALNHNFSCEMIYKS